MHLYAPTQSNAPKAPSPGNRPYNAEAMSAWQPTFKEHCNTALSIGVAAIKRASGRYFPSFWMSETAQHRGGASGYREGAGRAAHRTKPTTRYRRRAAPARAARGTFGLLQTARERGPPCSKRNSERMLEPEGSPVAQCIAHLVPRSQRLRPDTKHATQTPRPKGGWVGGRAVARPLCRAARSRPLP